MKISIITVCKDPGDLLKKTVESVFSQTYQDIEYIIVDGASTDGTVQYLEEIDAMIRKGERFFALTQCFKFISEPDSGIYNAMNKGIGLATGDILYFLNVGDALFDEKVIEKVMDHFKTGCNLIYCDICITGKDQVEIKNYDKVDRYFLFRDSLNHQACFFNRDCIDFTGKYDLCYSIASDYDMIMKIWNNDNLRKCYLSIVAVNYDADGISASKIDDLVVEREKIKRNNFSKFERVIYSCFLYQILRRRLKRSGLNIYG